MHLQEALESLKVSLGTSDTKFSAALGNDKRISVAGTVKGLPILISFQQYFALTMSTGHCRRCWSR